MLRNDFAFFAASYAAQRLGAYSVPVNWHGETQEIGYVLNDCGAKAVVAHADLLPEVVDDKPREIGRDGLVTLAMSAISTRTAISSSATARGTW